MEKTPAANLFIAMFTVDLKKLPALASTLLWYRTTVRLFLEDAKNFYRMTRFNRNQCTQLNVYPDYPVFMEYIRYHVQALMDSIMDQIQGETGSKADEVRDIVREIRQLIRTNKNELYESDEDGGRRQRQGGR